MEVKEEMKYMEDKKFTHLAKILLCIWNIGLFCIVWFQYYNRFAFDNFLLYGGIVTCVIFALIYLALCNIYKAFRIASTYIPDTVFGQTISFGIADLILYVECCLINNNYVNIIPGAITAVLQIAGTAIIVTAVKQHIMKVIKPKKTLLIYGKKISKEEAVAFGNRLLEKYSHLFEIVRVECERDKEVNLKELVEESEAVLLYELSKDKRSGYMKLCTELGKTFFFTPCIEDILCQGSSPKHFLDTPLMKYEYQYDSIKGYMGKRVLDVVLSLFCLIILSPVLLITAIAIKLEDGGPVFFKQKRCTKGGREFDILKFRSMIVEAEKNGATPCVGNDPRITKVGKVIRAMRIDELPQLINILKNDMSFVGPRPERIEHVEQYGKELPEFSYRLRVKGGLTGYAQIFGKYNTSAYDKLRLDLMYIENQSLFLDLKLLLLTFKVIFKTESTEGFAEEKSREINKKVLENG